MTQPAPARTSLLAGLVAVLAGIALLVSLDLDISPHRYLRNDVLFRGASSIEAIYSYPTMDPSPFSVALPANLFVRERLRVVQDSGAATEVAQRHDEDADELDGRGGVVFMHAGCARMPHIAERRQTDQTSPGGGELPRRIAIACGGTAGHVFPALALGVAPRAAAEFSFLLGILAIGGAAALTLPDLVDASPELMQAVWTGGAAALVSGIFAIWLFVKLLREHTFYRFAWWAWAAGLLFLAWQLL